MTGSFLARTTFAVILRRANVRKSAHRTEMIDDESNDAFNDRESFPTALNNSSTLHELRDRDNGDHTKELSVIEEPGKNSISKDINLANKLAKLTLDSDCESLNKFSELSVEDPYIGEDKLAGFVTAVAKILGFILVKPPMSRGFLLNLGTPLFLRKSSSAGVITNDVKVGQIIDVFGPTFEPYYCIKPIKNGIDLVEEGTRLSYAPGHPRTTFLRLERDGGNRYTVFYFDKRSGDDERIHRSRDMRDEESTRRQCRRRAGRDRRTYAAYGNSLNENLPGFYNQTRPKHLYFDY